MRSVPSIPVGSDSHKADGDYLGRMLEPMAVMTEAVVRPPSLSRARCLNDAESAAEPDVLDY